MSQGLWGYMVYGEGCICLTRSFGAGIGKDYDSTLIENLQVYHRRWRCTGSTFVMTIWKPFGRNWPFISIVFIELNPFQVHPHSQQRPELTGNNIPATAQTSQGPSIITNRFFCHTCRQKSPSLPMGHAVLPVIPSRCLKFNKENYWWRYLLFTSSYPNSTLWDLAVTLVTDTTQRRGCWSPLTAPCLGARLGVNEDWKLVGSLVVVKEPDEMCGWRRGWKFTLMEIQVFRTVWSAPWIISYFCSPNLDFQDPRIH